MWTLVWVLSLVYTAPDTPGVYQTQIFPNQQDCYEQINVYNELSPEWVHDRKRLRMSCRQAEQWLPVVEK